MGNKLTLRFLGLLETTQYTLEQSHGVPPISVALDNTTLREEGACGYSSVKTVRSIAKEGVEEILNLQPKGRQAKPYQVKQVRRVILKYRLGGAIDVP
jgi:hypothetical protein